MKSPKASERCVHKHCDSCGARLKPLRPEEVERAKKLWGEFKPEDMASVCDDCYKACMEWVVETHPEYLTKRKI